MKFASKILENIVDGFSALPGIGKKSALRVALHLAQKDKQKIIQFAEDLKKMADQLKVCTKCFSYSDHDICDICSSPHRNNKLLCVVESIKDVMAIEDTMQYNGKYLVLGGLISPIDGIGPDALNIQSLFQRIQDDKLDEIIMALRPSIEGDTTIYFISKNMPNPSVKISMIARGVAFGSELEYADEMTLGRSITSRVPYTLFENN